MATRIITEWDHFILMAAHQKVTGLRRVEHEKAWRIIQRLMAQFHELKQNANWWLWPFVLEVRIRTVQLECLLPSTTDANADIKQVNHNSQIHNTKHNSIYTASNDQAMISNSLHFILVTQYISYEEFTQHRWIPYTVHSTVTPPQESTQRSSLDKHRVEFYIEKWSQWNGVQHRIQNSSSFHF